MSNESPPPRRRSPWLWFLAALVAFSLVLFGGLVALLVWLGGGAPTPESGILEVRIEGPLPEGPDDQPLAELLALFDVETRRSLWDLRRALTAAVDDPNVKGVRLDVYGGPGWAASDEIAGLVERIRRAGKPVIAYLGSDFADDQVFFLAASADQVWLAPDTGLLVNGLRFEVEFWGGTLEKLHVQPSYLMLEEYKSAGEVYSRSEMSEPFREQLVAVGSDIQTRLVDVVAERRALADDAVRAEIDRGLITATEALEKGWVDGLGYPDDVERALAAAAGLSEYEGLPLGRYLADRGPGPEGGAVALIFGDGPIYASGHASPFSEPTIFGDRLARTITRAAEADDVEAIVLRVNSPGGSPVGSDLVWRAVRRAKEAGKPVVVSFSNLAGSGGYWVAMDADRIVAQPTSITGSIGVVFGKFNIRGLYDLVGANVSDVTLAENADILSFFEPMEPSHEARITAWMTEVYQHFQEKVAEGRGLDREHVAQIAKGRIYSGIDALEIGLVDELGGLDRAIALARELAGLPDTAVATVYPRRRPLFELLSSGELEVRMPQPRGSLLTELAPEVARELASPRPWALMPRFRID